MMGRPMKPYKTEPTDMLNVKHSRQSIGWFKSDLDNSNLKYKTGDAGYVDWVKKHDDEEYPKQQAVAFLNRLTGKPGVVAELASELLGKIRDITRFETKLQETTMNEMEGGPSHVESLKDIHKMAQDLAVGKDQNGRTFSKILYELNKETGGKYAKENSFKALFHLSNQLDRSLADYESVAINQINSDVELRNSQMKYCMQKLSQYNEKAYHYAWQDTEVPFFGTKIEGPEMVEKIYEQKKKELHDSVIEAEKELQTCQELTGEKQRECTPLDEKKAEAEKNLEKANEALEAAKATLDHWKLQVEEQENRLKEMENSEPSSSENVNAEEKADGVEDFNLLAEKAEADIKADEQKLSEAEKEFETKKADFDTRLFNASHNPSTKNELFNDKDIAAIPQLKAADREIEQTQTDSSSLTGQLNLTQSETETVIEALRTKLPSDIKKISQKAMPVYTWSMRYASYFDMLYRDEEVVKVGNGFMSFKYDCTAGVVAAMNILGSTIPTKENPNPLAVSVKLRSELSDLQGKLSAFVSSIKDYQKIQAEKEAFVNDGNAHLDEMRNAIEKKKLDLEKIKESAAEQNAEKAQKQEVEKYKDIQKDQHLLVLEETKKQSKEAQAAYDLASKNKKTREEELKKVTEEFNKVHKEADEADEAEKAAFEKLKKLKTSSKKDLETLEKEHGYLVKDAAELVQMKKSCAETVHGLRSEKENICQMDERSKEVLEKITNFYDNVEVGNTFKNGKWDHKNGSHYTALKESLLNLKNDLAAGKLSNQEIVTRLTGLQQTAQAYLDARAKDWGYRLFGGTTFRYNRMMFATDIVNTCGTMSGLLAKELKTTDETMEKEIASADSTIMPEPAFSNQEQLQRNWLEYSSLGEEKNNAADTYTEVENDFFYTYSPLKASNEKNMDNVEVSEADMNKLANEWNEHEEVPEKKEIAESGENLNASQNGNVSENGNAPEDGEKIEDDAHTVYTVISDSQIPGYSELGDQEQPNQNEQPKQPNQLEQPENNVGSEQRTADEFEFALDDPQNFGRLTDEELEELEEQNNQVENLPSI